jgi:hypothetical protein
VGDMALLFVGPAVRLGAQEAGQAGAGVRAERVAGWGAADLLLENNVERFQQRVASGGTRIDRFSVFFAHGLILHEEQVDLLLLMVNPFRLDPDLGWRGFSELAFWWQEKTDFPLNRCVELAAGLLCDVTPEGLKELRTGWEHIPLEVLKEARLQFDEDSKSFRVEGIPPHRAAQVLTSLKRIAESIAGNDLSQWVLEDLARGKRPCVVVCSHADLLPYMKTITRDELRSVGLSVFPTDRAVRPSQVVVHGSLDIVLRADAQQPIWKRGLNKHGEELLNAVQKELAHLRRNAKHQSAPVQTAAAAGRNWSVALATAGVGALLLAGLIVSAILQTPFFWAFLVGLLVLVFGFWLWTVAQSQAAAPVRAAVVAAKPQRRRKAKRTHPRALPVREASFNNGQAGEWS